VTEVDDKRARVLDAALEIADEQGLAAVTMRAVAARVGLSAMALYPRVGGKEGLLDGLVERLLAELMSIMDTKTARTSTVDGKPVDRLMALARAVRELARRHPAAFSLMFARPSTTPESVRQLDTLYGMLLDAGVPPEHVPRIERLLSTFALGFATSEVAGRFSAADPRRAVRGLNDPAVFPAHAKLSDVLEQGVDWDKEYEQDLADLFFLIRHRWTADKD
jgi:AcrR family transcriptional regulator